MEPVLAADFRRFNDNATDVVDGALLIARLIDPDAKVAWALSEIDRLALDLEPVDTPRELVEGLSGQGFAGAAAAYSEAESSALDKVLERKRGLPISLAVVVIAVAQRLGFEADGINFPGHFLARVKGTLVDPFALECTTEANCRQWLAKQNVPSDNAFQIASPAAIVLRMLNNLKMMASAEHNYVRALEITDYQGVMLPEAFGLHVERAELWSALGSIEMTKHELEQARDRAPDEKVRASIEARLQTFGPTENTLN